MQASKPYAQCHHRQDRMVWNWSASSTSISIALKRILNEYILHASIIYAFVALLTHMQEEDADEVEECCRIYALIFSSLLAFIKIILCYFV